MLYNTLKSQLIHLCFDILMEFFYSFVKCKQLQNSNKIIYGNEEKTNCGKQNKSDKKWHHF